MSEINTEEKRGELLPTEWHPATEMAREFLNNLPFQGLEMYRAGFSSVAIENNRLGEVCSETIRRLMFGGPVGDRYLLGLAWVIRNIEMSRLLAENNRLRGLCCQAHHHVDTVKTKGKIANLSEQIGEELRIEDNNRS